MVPKVASSLREAWIEKRQNEKRNKEYKKHS